MSKTKEVDPKKKWREAQVDSGNCAKCGKERKSHSRLCDAHNEKQKVYQTAYNHKKRGAPKPIEKKKEK